MNFYSSRLLAAILLVPALACEKAETTPPAHTDDQIDQVAKSLLWSLRVGDRADLDATFPKLASEIDDRDLAVLSRTLTWLGQEIAFVRVAEQQVVQGVERQYRVVHEQGEFLLTITMLDGAVVGFSFDEPGWTPYVDQAAAAAAGSLHVAEFRYVDRKGKPMTGPLDPAGINYELVLEGLGAMLREHHVAVVKAVFDKGGHQVFRQANPDEVRFSQADPAASGGRISGTVAVPGPGSYELVLDIQDVAGEQALTHRVPFTIE
jgi:hypothetical protein